MLSFDPSWGMCTTTTHRWTCSGHLWVTSNTSKAIPSRGNISLITSDWALPSKGFEAVGCIEVLVVAAWVIRCNTVSKRACRRFLQFIDVKGAAVLNFNVVFPPTAIVCPMIANFATHFTVRHRRMLSFDPSWGMRPTTTHRWACSGHLWVTSNTSKAIPSRGNISLITSDWALSSERFEAVGCIEALVVAAWVIRCNTVSKRTCRRFFQLIDVKGTAVLNFNVVFPPTTIVCPMIANFTSHFAVRHRGMLSFDPSWGMCTTTMHRWTCSGHLWVTGNTSEAIPSRGNISLITSDWALSSERFEAVGCI